MQNESYSESLSGLEQAFMDYCRFNEGIGYANYENRKAQQAQRETQSKVDDLLNLRSRALVQLQQYLTAEAFRELTADKL